MKALSLVLMLAATPALASEGGPFFSLHNGHLIVAVAFIIFVAVLVKMKVPGMIGGMLDKRIDQIKVDLEEARLLREEAQTILASYERRQKEVQAQAERIVSSACDEALAAAEQAKVDLKSAISRRMVTAEEQLASAETAVLREVRDRAITVAVAAAGHIMAKQMTPESAGVMVDQSIEQVGARLN